MNDEKKNEFDEIVKINLVEISDWMKSVRQIATKYFI